MADMIKIDDLKADLGALFLSMITKGENTVEVSAVTEIINKQPVIDAEPVRNGQWLCGEFDGYADGNPVYFSYICSECGKEYETDDEPIDFDYCPRCGAKLDENVGEQDA